MASLRRVISPKLLLSSSTAISPVSCDNAQLANLGTPVIKEFVSMILLCAFFPPHFCAFRIHFALTKKVPGNDLNWPSRQKGETGQRSREDSKQSELGCDCTLGGSLGPPALRLRQGPGAPALTRGRQSGRARTGARGKGRGRRALLTCGPPRRTAPAGNRPPAAGSHPRPPPSRRDTSAWAGRAGSGAGLRPQRPPAAPSRPCAGPATKKKS